MASTLRGTCGNIISLCRLLLLLVKQYVLAHGPSIRSTPWTKLQGHQGVTTTTLCIHPCPGLWNGNTIQTAWMSRRGYVTDVEPAWCCDVMYWDRRKTMRCFHSEVLSSGFPNLSVIFFPGRTCNFCSYEHSKFCLTIGSNESLVLSAQCLPYTQAWPLVISWLTTNAPWQTTV
jgi:hypothetical protein